MSGTSLCDFVSHAMDHKRISFGDLRRLQRDILPARITTREQAEMLIALDRSVDRADRDWRDYLHATVRDFVIWGSLPAGRIDGDKAEWLATALRHSSPKTASAISREVVRQAPEVDDAVQAILTGSQREKARNEARAVGATPSSSLRPYPAGMLPAPEPWAPEFSSEGPLEREDA